MAIRNFWAIRDNKIAKGTIEFKWEPGMSLSQKTKSCHNMHTALLLGTGLRALDISSASYVELGVKLSAFNLKYGDRTIECLYQGSKCYEDGYIGHELYDADSMTAKLSMKRPHGKLTGFNYFGKEYPLEPKTVFYDFLYLHGMLENYGRDLELPYGCFTDVQAVTTIDACQARAVCEYKLLQEQNNFDVLQDFEKFSEWHSLHVESIYPACKPMNIRWLDKETVACATSWEWLLRERLQYTEKVINKEDNIVFKVSRRKTIAPDSDWCVVYTDLLLDDLCALEYLSHHYRNIYCITVNEDSLGDSIYAAKSVRDLNAAYVVLTKWFHRVILTKTSVYSAQDDLSRCDCYLLANATKLVRDIESGVKFHKIVGMIGSENTEWNASQDINSYHKLKQIGFEQYDAEFCESNKTYPSDDLSFLDEYITTMTSLNENTCCYDLQAVAAALRRK